MHTNDNWSYSYEDPGNEYVMKGNYSHGASSRDFSKELITSK